MKTCPACKKQSGPRTKQCECGHLFSTAPAAVAASSAPMTTDPLNDRLADSTKEIKGALNSAKTILQRAESRRSLSLPEPWEVDSDKDSDDALEAESTPEETSQVLLKPNQGGRRTTYVPAGDCPVKPAGYKAGWPDGPASDLVVQNWAVRVYNLRTDLQPHAVVYWARYYWDMNDVSVDAAGNKVYGQEWRRIRGLILSAITGEEPDHESADEMD